MMHFCHQQLSDVTLSCFTCSKNVPFCSYIYFDDIRISTSQQLVHGVWRRWHMTSSFCAAEKSNDAQNTAFYFNVHRLWSRKPELTKMTDNRVHESDHQIIRDEQLTNSSPVLSCCFSCCAQHGSKLSHGCLLWDERRRWFLEQRPLCLRVDTELRYEQENPC